MPTVATALLLSVAAAAAAAALVATAVAAVAAAALQAPIQQHCCQQRHDRVSHGIFDSLHSSTMRSAQLHAGIACLPSLFFAYLIDMCNFQESAAQAIVYVLNKLGNKFVT